MFVGSKRTSGTARLGEILVEAGVIEKELINESLPIAKRSNLPLGRVLSMCGFMHEKVIESAVRAQKGLREGRLNRTQASHIVLQAFHSRMPITPIRHIVNFEQSNDRNYSELPKLLLHAGILEKEVLDQAIVSAKQEKRTLGVWLVENEMITGELLVNALHVALLYRHLHLSKDQAVSIIQVVSESGMGLLEAAFSLGLGTLPEEKEIDFAAFLIVSGLADQYTVVCALEKAIDTCKTLGHTLVEIDAISATTFDAAVGLSEMFDLGILSQEEVCEIASMVLESGMTLEQVLVEVERMQEIGRFILAAGLITPEIRQEHDFCEEVPDVLMGHRLVNSNLVNDTAVFYAAHLIQLIKNRAITDRQAIGILHYCLRYRMNPNEAIKKFGLAMTDSRDLRLQPA
jgi:hypothetical protein